MFDRPATPGEVAAATLERLEQHPETLDQSYWFSVHVPDHPTADRQVMEGDTFLTLAYAQEAEVEAEAWSECGIAGCAAGHTIAAAIELGYPIMDARTECGMVGTGSLAEWLLGLVELDEGDDGEYGELGTSQLSMVTDEHGRMHHLFDGGSVAPSICDIKRGLQGIIDYEQEVAA